MDDEEMIRTIASSMLTSLGFRAVTCATGEEAVDLYQKARESGLPFCAVIMDLIIYGGMGGKDAAARILEFDPRARLIVSSGYSDEPVMANHASYGFQGQLPKPYLLADLARLLEGLLPCKL